MQNASKPKCNAIVLPQGDSGYVSWIPGSYTRTLSFLPLEVTEQEAAIGFRRMVLDLNSYFGLGDGVEVVARTLSSTDVVIKIRSSRKRDFYEHIRFGFVPQFMNVRWPWIRIGWHALKPWHYEAPDADFSKSLANTDVIGVAFEDHSV